MTRLLPIFLVTISFAIGPIIALTATSHRNDAIQLVLLPPWIDRDAVLADANARPIGPVAAPFGILATDMRSGGNLGERLRNSGAWAVFDGSVLASICGIA